MKVQMRSPRLQGLPWWNGGGGVCFQLRMRGISKPCTCTGWLLTQESLCHLVQSLRPFPPLGSLDEAVLPVSLQQPCPVWFFPATHPWACPSLWLEGATSLIPLGYSVLAKKPCRCSQPILTSCFPLSLIHAKVTQHEQSPFSHDMHTHTLSPFHWGSSWNFRMRISWKDLTMCCYLQASLECSTEYPNILKQTCNG